MINTPLSLLINRKRVLIVPLTSAQLPYPLPTMLPPKVSLAALGLAHLASSASVAPYPVRIETRSQLTSRAANIHISYDKLIDGLVSFTYGSCHARSEADAHHTIGRHTHTSRTTDRLVWLIPEYAFPAGCISAWSVDDGALLGRSEPQQLASVRGRKRNVEEVHKRAVGLKKRDGSGGAYSIGMTNASGIDAWGPWFDGVELLQSKNLSAVDVAAAKTKKIGIVGAGMSGLMTYLALTQAGFTDLEIIEGGERLGGRVHTVYLTGGPFDYSYQGQSFLSSHA